MIVKNENKLYFESINLRENPEEQEILLFIIYIILSTITVSPKKLRIVDIERTYIALDDTNIARYRTTIIWKYVCVNEHKEFPETSTDLMADSSINSKFISPWGEKISVRKKINNIPLESRKKNKRWCEESKYSRNPQKKKLCAIFYAIAVYK